MAGLMLPNIVDQYNQGFDRGQGLRANRLAGLALTSQGADRASALGQLAGVNPQAAMSLQDRFAGQDQQQAQAQQAAEVDHNKKLNGAARFVLQAVQTGDPNRIQGAWSAVRPYLTDLTGKQPPDQFDPAMLPKMYEIVGQSGGMPESKPVILSNGAQLVDPSSGKVLSDNPLEQHDTGELATLRAMQQDPSLLDTYRRAHPRAVAGGGMGHAPSGYRYTKDGSLEPIPGGPADDGDSSRFALTPDAIDNAAWNTILTGKAPSIGRGKEGIAQRTAIYNRMGEIASRAGVSPAELSTTAGRNKALQASLTNLQKISDVMEKSEIGFQNNTQTALDLSAKIDRSGSPVVNKWVLGGKKALGDPDVEALDAAITTMAVDYARIMSGATGAGGTPISTAEEAKSLIRKELSHKSFQAVVDVLNRDIAGQQRAVEHQRGKILGGMQALGVDQSQPTPAAPQQGGGWSIEPVQ